MAKATEGVIAINKPPNITSAQVIRDLQTQFNPSKFFAPWLQAERDRLQEDKNSRFNSKNRWKKKRSSQVKVGHGGTLDPAATGVLILGLGSGTKELATFLDCTKSYEAVVLFGAATDSYDGEGKIIGRKAFSHITKGDFEKALQRFRGKTKQKPPIFSALWMDGKRLYEYAREGKALPRKIEERDVSVDELELVEWLEPGSHSFKFPEVEAPQEEQEGALKLMNDATSEDSAVKNSLQDASTDQQDSPKEKRKHADEETQDESDSSPVIKRARTETDASIMLDNNAENAAEDPIATNQPPAARIRMTVNGGFYVRSLCHDLGLALNSFGLMASLVRTRQGNFKLDDDILQYDDLKAGEETWAPKVQRMLDKWRERDG